MNMKNPYNVNIGSIPEKYIENKQINNIVGGFINDELANYIIYGPSGSGKTVAITMIYNKLKEQKDWIAINLNPSSSPITDLVGKLYDTRYYAKEFIDSEFNLSIMNIGFDIKTNQPAASLESALIRIMSVMKKKNKKLIVCIDELVYREELYRFFHSVQIAQRENLPIHLLLCGLYNDIEEYFGMSGFSFFCRIPMEQIQLLDVNKITEDYMHSFCIDGNQAMSLALITKGFPTAYQIIGKTVWGNKEYDVNDSFLGKIDDLLYQYAYRDLIYRFSKKNICIIQNLLKKGNYFSVDNIADEKISIIELSKAGVVRKIGDDEYAIVLPRFREIFLEKVEFEES